MTWAAEKLSSLMTCPDPAGILGAVFSADAQGIPATGTGSVALIDHFPAIFFPVGAQGNVAVFVHADMAALRILHGHADAGLRKSQLIGDIDGTDVWLIQTEP